MIKLQFDKKTVHECFGIDDAREIDIRADIEKFMLKSKDPLAVIQYIWNSEYFSEIEKIYLTYKMGQIDGGMRLTFVSFFRKR